MYKNLIVYYFSGTGNALRASEWLSEKAKEHGIKVSIQSIDRFDSINKPVHEGKTLIAFCYPTHCFNAAPLMLKFIARFPTGKEDVIFVNTRGGLKFKKVYFPGLSGAAILLPMLILLVKGYKISGALPFDLPSNWISVHPGLTDAAINDIVSRRKSQINNFADRLYKNERAYSYKFFVYMPLDVAVIPIMIGYYFFFRYILAKTFYASADCNDCRICEIQCPTNSIKIVNGRPFWSYTCESCMRCIGICPKKSIQTAHSFIIPVMYLISFIPIIAAAYNVLDIYIGPGIAADILVKIINWAVTIFLTSTAYRIFSYILKVKFFNRIFEYTSLTRYWRRYTAPGVGIKDLKIYKRES